jgi:hypothetical protein
MKQEFAEAENDLDNEDNDEAYEDGTDDGDTLDDEQEVEETTVDSEDENAVDENDTNSKIPRARFVEEKKKRQAIEAENEALKIQLQAIQGNSEEKEFSDYLEKKKQKYISMGYAEDLAQGLAEDLTEQFKMTKSLSGKSTETETVVDKDILEITKLKSESEYYDNADAFIPQIKQKMKELKITAKQAYNLIVEPETRQKELMQRQRAKGVKTDTAKSQPISSNAGGLKTNDAVTLSKREMEVFKILQSEDPKKWTITEYKKYLKK